MADGRTCLEEINFLADSVYRSAVLAELRDGPRVRAELSTDTGASSATLSRILRAFEDRDWIVRVGQHYELTPPGVLIAVGFDDLLHRLEMERKLRGIWRLLPAELLKLDPEWMMETTITLPSKYNPLAPMDRAATMEYEAARSRVLTHALPDPCLNAHRHGIAAGTHRLEAVISRDVARTVAETSHATWICDALATDRLDLFVTDADVPYVIGINDDTVYFGIDDERGAPLALIETTDQTLLAWAEWTFETYRRDANPLSSDAFLHLCDADDSTIADRQALND